MRQEGNVIHADFDTKPRPSQHPLIAASYEMLFADDLLVVGRLTYRMDGEVVHVSHIVTEANA